MSAHTLFTSSPPIYSSVPGNSASALLFHWICSCCHLRPPGCKFSGLGSPLSFRQFLTNPSFLKHSPCLASLTPILLVPSCLSGSSFWISVAVPSSTQWYTEAMPFICPCYHLPYSSHDYLSPEIASWVSLLLLFPNPKNLFSRHQPRPCMICLPLSMLQSHLTVLLPWLNTLEPPWPWYLLEHVSLFPTSGPENCFSPFSPCHLPPTMGWLDPSHPKCHLLRGAFSDHTNSTPFILCVTTEHYVFFNHLTHSVITMFVFLTSFLSYILPVLSH